MKNWTRPLAVFAAAAIALSLTGCGVSKEEIMGVIAPTATPEPTSVVQTAAPAETETPKAECLSCTELTGCFSPFWAETDGDRMVVADTQLGLLDERNGETPVAVEKTLNDDGSVTVSMEIRGGLRFSDGTPVDADDLLFTYYVLLDPDYSGPCQVNALPIRGLADYLTGVPAALYAKYGEEYDKLYNGGKYDADLQKAVEDAENAVPSNSWNTQQAKKALEEYDQDKAAQIKSAIEQCWREDAQRIVDFCMENFASTVEYHTGYTLEQVRQSEGLQVMFAMVEWSIATLNSDGTLVGKKSGTVWDLQNSFPTTEDFYNEMAANYGGDAEAYWQVEGVGRRSMLEIARNQVVSAWAAQDKDWTGPVTSVSGIDRVGDRLITVTLDTYSAGDLDTLCGVYLAPLHWYGDKTLYDYANGSYGFPFGDLSAVRAKNAQPLGAGEYVYADWSDGAVRLTANTDYWAGPPENDTVEISVGS